MCNEGSEHVEVTEATPSGRSFDMKVTESFSGLQIKTGICAFQAEGTVHAKAQRETELLDSRISKKASGAEAE